MDRRRFLVAAVAAASWACGSAMPSPAGSASADAPIASAPPRASSAAATPTPDPVVSIATGPWRRQPVAPTGTIAEVAEAACRASEPKIGGLPVALVDLRGEGLATFVFAEGATGFACWSDLEPGPDATVIRLAAPAKRVDGIDVALYQVLTEEGGQRSVVVGRLGPIDHPRATLGAPIAARVIAGFTNETYVWGSMSDAWYALWWPGAEASDGIAVTNSRNEVIVSVQLELPDA